VEPLLENLHSLLHSARPLNEERYHGTKEKLTTPPKVKPFEVNESETFGKRVQKRIKIFTSIQPCSSVANHECEGMDKFIKYLIQIIDEFKCKPFDYSNNTVDRDFLEFNMKESKKTIRTYNKMACALIEYDTLWHHACYKSIEATKSCMQATIIIRHPRLGMVFNREILQMFREAKILQRMGINVPERACMVLLQQEDKVKSYFNELVSAIEEYEGMLALVQPVCKPIIQPHLEDLDRKIQPGMMLLTWQSMNIDGYVHRLHTRIEELIHKINDIMENHIEFNLGHISRAMTVNLPQNQSFTLDQVCTQTRACAEGVLPLQLFLLARPRG